jgi:hypothetical protein
MDRPLRAFVVHLSTFTVIVAALAALNLYSNPQKIWFIWVFASWGIGLAAHGFAILMKRKTLGGSLAADEKARGFLIHLFVYIAVNAMLFAVNLLYTPDFYWFLFPLFGWGVGLLAHGIAVFRRRRTGAS